jgi:hypothetical protein
MDELAPVVEPACDYKQQKVSLEYEIGEILYSNKECASWTCNADNDFNAWCFPIQVNLQMVLWVTIIMTQHKCVRFQNTKQCRT